MATLDENWIRDRLAELAVSSKAPPSRDEGSRSGSIRAYQVGPTAASIGRRARDRDRQCVLKEERTAAMWTSDAAIYSMTKPRRSPVATASARFETSSFS